MKLIDFDRNNIPPGYNTWTSDPREFVFVDANTGIRKFVFEPFYFKLAIKNSNLDISNWNCYDFKKIIELIIEFCVSGKLTITLRPSRGRYYPEVMHWDDIHEFIDKLYYASWPKFNIR